MNGVDGVLALMIKHFLETGELEHYISESKLADNPNRKHGKGKKTVHSLSCGEVELETGMTSLSTFEPKVVPKRLLIIAKELEGTAAGYPMGYPAAEISQITTPCF